MFIIITIFVIAVCTIIAIMRSDKSLKHILAEAKYEVIYNILGSKAILEDFLRKGSNRTDLPTKSGQIAVITGGARGIGVEVVKMLMQCDMRVIIGCRNVAAGEKLESIARKDGITTGSIDVFQVDVGSLKSVREFAKIVSEKYPRINLLINNAGIMFGPYVETVDGFESQFGINYLGHFLLTHLLLPNLAAAGDADAKSRVVNVSSCAHLVGDINFEDINYKQQYIASAAYGQSKLAQVLFTKYLDEILKNKNIPVQIYSVHPGVVNTDLFEGTLIKKFLPFLPALFFKSPIQGATPIVYTAISPKLENKSGCYISNCRLSHTNPLSKNPEIQEKLFNLSKKLTNIEEYGKPT